MAARTGEEFLKGLKGKRDIWVGTDKVEDVVDHPAFSGAAHGLAGVFDLQHRYADDCLMPDPETGEQINVSHMIPRSREDIYRRHKGLARIAEYTVGIMGRSPDYMNVTYAGFAGRSDEWGANGNEEGAQNLVNYQKFLRRNDISLTHTIVHPTVDKAAGDLVGPPNEVPLHKVGETEHGIIVRGARVLATLAPFADELAVYPGQPIRPDADDYALAFCIPMDTPGLKFLCRDSCAGTQNKLDHPLSSRFDEQDAFVIFDDVEVPRDRIHINCNVGVYNQVMSTGWFPNVMQQTMIRAQTKLEFAWGLATRMSEAVGSLQPGPVQMLGEMWSYAEFARACIQAAEESAYEFGNGVWFPNGAPLTALKATLPTWFPRVNEIIRLLGSHNLLATPSAAQLANPELRPLIDRYMHGANGMDAETRARIFRLAWDFAGSALASRGEQYERFYLSSGQRNQQLAHIIADRTRADKLVDRFLKEDTGVEAGQKLAEAV
ncbi:4-hydroxyphenylacetate 3-hydroxylase N-terminal domain-containing protein [Parvibaculum sp.]|jgi:4-hydroxyphenylacetate 3-monooxygenase|uniref:4-hydroxyphenylacetate 3-hydroxylase family protein n=1 Tax=Parvibaculum sp. TaxID=2024848 RepID=UPI000C4385C2|nr:4-hydroxyphenylacetate 3-hydroxylase N-terminal domain-containing protein [Parvibaculum sp.]MAM93413.1 4-hydroxyphenylacetate 3-hydroxylase [Parvibaculum sp.]HCX68414.1 4-hydroxyphenylacetate 3-hydroxylase [Rhodobiaceae bacterium]|tara:strand:- start:2711 stop:4186 length:1476 start_codon:yes stop_codon:yes gene_type:complete